VKQNSCKADSELGTINKKYFLFSAVVNFPLCCIGVKIAAGTGISVFSVKSLSKYAPSRVVVSVFAALADDDVAFVDLLPFYEGFLA